MIAEGDDIILVCTGGKAPTEFKYWHWYNYSKPVAEFLKTLNPKGGFGKAYYYSERKIWFRREKYLTMYLLIKE
jgi:hypothetical protein